jgi:hypothetical protein
MKGGMLSRAPIGLDLRRATATLVTCATVVLTVGAASTAAGASTQPSISGVSPSYGSFTGNTGVTISGKNFTGATAVAFGLKSAQIVSVSSATISAVSPAGTGLVDVVVSTPSGTSKINANDKFNYGPTVGSLTASYGPPAGGTIVTVDGTNFTGATTVTFGTTALTSTTTNPPPSGHFTLVSDTQIIASSPPGTGIVSVVVTTPGGTSKVNGSDKFNYGPTVACPSPPSTGCPVNPSYGPPVGGTIVTVDGTNFTGANTVNFGTTALTSTTTNPPPSGHFTLVSDTQIIANSPPGTGIVNVVVTTSGGASSLSAIDRFSYAPVVTGLSPSSGPATGGTIVTVNGSNFTGASTVTFGTTALAATTTNPPPSGHFTLVSDTQIIANSPPGHVPTVTVTVTTPGGTSLGGPGTGFNYGPVVALVKPDTGVGSGGTKVSVIGMDLKGVSAVDFGTTPADSFSVKSSRKVVAIAPAGTGLVDVTVQSEAGTSPKVPTDRFEYAPTLTAIRPNHGKAAGGTKVTLIGINFTGVTAVDFGSNPATTFTVKSAKKISVLSPPGTGTVHVTVVTLGGTSPGSPSDQFTYD